MQSISPPYFSSTVQIAPEHTSKFNQRGKAKASKKKDNHGASKLKNSHSGKMKTNYFV